MKTKTGWKPLAIAISIGVVLLGVSVYSATTNILVEGTIPDSQMFDGPAKVIVRTLTIKPGDDVPWHYHPGHAFNVVKSGTLTIEDGCGRVQTLTPGQGFEEIDGRVHRPKNLGNTDVVVYDTFILREGKPTTTNLPKRRCGPPNDVDECKNDGWRKFNHPQTFSNQRQCVKFVRQRPRNIIPHS
jgi:quercetin dioxygenase-like cupin family protein